jgi:hypothetical protein
VICALLNGDLDRSKGSRGSRFFSFLGKALKAPDEKKPAMKAG